MADDDTLRRWATDTWRSLDALTVPATGLTSDHLDADLDPATRAGYTSPTNIGGYLWSTVAARDLGLVGADECRDRCAATLAALGRMRRHPGSGMFVNWYDEASGDALTALPGGEPFVPFLSSVDNGWLAAGLMVVAAAVPSLRAPAERLLDGMDFARFHDPDAGPPGPGGRLRGGFWEGEPERMTGHHYDLLNSEPRIASYVGTARGQLPPEHLGALTTERREYRGRSVVATFGGSMFEALMPDLLVPEEEWAPATWDANHRDTVALQREYALEDRGYAAWGFSPSACPGSGYDVFGVPPIAWLPDGYPSERDDEPVVTPHASALALLHEPEEAAANLAVLEDRFGCYGPGGFVDSVGLVSGRTAGRHLALDQAMVMAALAHGLGQPLRRWFCTPEVTAVLRPVVAGLRFEG